VRGEYLQFLNELSHCFHIDVILRLCQQVGDAEATLDNEDHNFVEFGRYQEQFLIDLLQVDLLHLSLDHIHLLLVKELPNFLHGFEVFLCNLDELRLLIVQLLFCLLFQHFIIEAQESLD
jgi:hypothetical protein